MTINQTDLQMKLDNAQEAENSEDFFRAAFLYRDTLTTAIKEGNSDVIKLCKNKSVEMNKKSIASGKDFKELSFTQGLPNDKKKAHEEFISKFLSQGDLKTILRAIGKHPFFFPKVVDVQKSANKTMPISYQIASLSTISNDGHTLRGGSEGSYAWFMKMYDLNQQLIMTLYVGRIIYELMENKPNGSKLTIDILLDYFNNSRIIEEGNLKIISVGLQKYFDRDYISALHILVPQFESVFLKISERCDIDIVALDQKQGIATRTKTLSEYYLDSDEFKKVWDEDFCRQIKFILFEQLGYKIRHKIAHGEITKEECNFQNTTLILYLYLVLLSRVNIKSE
jgi:hypothetical protein